MRGIADGAGLALDQIAALNVRYELLYYQFGQNATTVRRPDGCTAFAVAPSASAEGHLLIGENWDWIPEVRGALVRTTEADGLTTLGFTEAGIFGAKIGLNSAGLGLLINGMVATSDDWARRTLPFHARCRAILRSHCLDDAVAVVTGTDRPCAANYLIAQVPDRIVDIEAAPDRVRCWPDEAGCLCHTNHFLDPRALGVVEPEIERGPDSQLRLARMRHLLGAGQGPGTLWVDTLWVGTLWVSNANNPHLAHVPLHRFAIDDQLMVARQNDFDPPRAIGVSRSALYCTKIVETA